MPRLSLPAGMAGRIALILIAAVTVEFIGNSLINLWQEKELLSAERTRRIAGQIVVAERVVADVRPDRRSRVAADLSLDGLVLNWVPATVIADSSAAHARLQQVKHRLIGMAPALAGRDIRLVLIASAKSGKRDLIGALRLADGSFVTFRVTPFLNAPPAFALVLALHLLLIAAVLGMGLLLVRTLVRPLRALAALADATGQGSQPAMVIEGPREVRRVATAFSAMQARLLNVMAEHTQALVAVSHDLRTPIQRLRLRAALLADREARDAIDRDLAELEKFVGSIVSFMRGDGAEAARLVDVAAIAMTAVDDAADAGAAITYQGPDALAATLRPLALKRALANIVDNAVAHAATIRVRLTADAAAILLTVEDDGPGIPADRRAEVLLPFRRLEPARRQDSGGAGLGLAIASKAVSALSGTLVLGDSALGGLSVTLRVPRHSEAAAE